MDVWRKAREALLVAYDAALATAPSTRIEAEPVTWIESEESTRGMDPRNFINGMCHTVLWHSKKPVTGNPVWEVRPLIDPPDRTPDARSTSDAAVVLQELVDAKANHSKPGSDGPERMRQAWVAARTFLADRTKESTTTREAEADSPVLSGYAKAHRTGYQRGLADATRSTDSSAEAAGMERAAQVCERMGEQFGASETDTSHQSVVRRAILATCLDLALNIRAEAAKLTGDANG